MKVADDEFARESLLETFGLEDHEQPWVPRYKYLLSRGYRIDSRYDPNWSPSWHNRDVDALGEMTEESLPGFFRAHPDAMTDFHYRRSNKDAVRLSDGLPVVIKLAPGNEAAMLRVLSALQFDPYSPAIPLLDVFPVEAGDVALNGPWGADCSFIVMPLMLEWNWPPFSVVGDVLAFVCRLLQGLEFLHGHNIAHGDIHSSNIMMDPTAIAPQGIQHKENMAITYGFDLHTQFHNRIDVPGLRYRLVDFGSSFMFPPGVRPLVMKPDTVWDAPEMTTPAGMRRPYDPFPADVYQLGCFLHEEFSESVPELRPLMQGMLKKSPRKRPDAAQCLKYFLHIASALPATVIACFMPNPWEKLCSESWTTTYLRYRHFQHISCYMRDALKSLVGDRDTPTAPPTHSRIRTRSFTATQAPSPVDVRPRLLRAQTT